MVQLDAEIERRGEHVRLRRVETVVCATDHEIHARCRFNLRLDDCASLLDEVGLVVGIGDVSQHLCSLREVEKLVELERP